MTLINHTIYFLCGLAVSACSRVKQNKLACLNSVCNQHTLVIHLATISAPFLAHFFFAPRTDLYLSIGPLLVLHSVYPQTCQSCSPSKTQRTSTFRLILFIMYKKVVGFASILLFLLFFYDHKQQWFCVWQKFC